MLEKMRTAPATFERAAWSVLAYNVLVILWGAVVRATGSGAGCGDHWPLCNGAIVPRAPAIETVVEFTHRLTSGVALMAVVALLLTALASFPKGHVVRSVEQDVYEAGCSLQVDAGGLFYYGCGRCWAVLPTPVGVSTAPNSYTRTAEPWASDIYIVATHYAADAHVPGFEQGLQTNYPLFTPIVSNRR